jgi:hypothetical protein
MLTGATEISNNSSRPTRGERQAENSQNCPRFEEEIILPDIGTNHLDRDNWPTLSPRTMPMVDFASENSYDASSDIGSSSLKGCKLL